MNSHLLLFLKNTSYLLFSNLISLLISVFLVFIVPKVVGIEAYGYWQLYLFYTSYIGFLHFGWIEGLYLKYGGYTYEDLDKNNLRTQFWILNFCELCLSAFLLICVFFFIDEANKKIVFFSFICNILLIVPKTFLAYVLLSTSRIRAHSILILTERFVTVIAMIVLLLWSDKTYQSLIFADIAGKTTVLCLAVYFCHRIVWGEILVTHVVFIEIKKSIISGSKLMLANIASMLMIGIVRFSIEKHWGIVLFGKVSMALSASALFMMFVSTLNVVVFPLLRKVQENELAEIYTSFRSLLLKGSLAALLLYYPISKGLDYWLPAYRESSAFLAVLFPSCVYEIQWSILLYTYFKTLRKEKWVLVINLIAVGLSIVFTGVTVLFLNNVFAVLVSVTLLVMLRCFIAEFFLKKAIKIEGQRRVFLEVFCGLAFIYTAYTMPSIYGIILYSFVYFLYFRVTNDTLRRDVNTVIKFIRGT